MKVKELSNILDGYYPDDEVVLVMQSGRVIQIVGVNNERTERNGALTIDVDWSLKEGRIVETEEERIEREKIALRKQIDKLSEKQKQILRKRITNQPRANRTEKEVLQLEVMGDEGKKKSGRKPGKKKAKKGSRIHSRITNSATVCATDVDSTCVE